MNGKLELEGLRKSKVPNGNLKPFSYLVIFQKSLFEFGQQFLNTLSINNFCWDDKQELPQMGNQGWFNLVWACYGFETVLNLNGLKILYGIKTIASVLKV